MFFYMNIPLIGTSENNYRFFYIVSVSVVGSLLILLIITGYTAFIATNVGN